MNAANAVSVENAPTAEKGKHNRTFGWLSHRQFVELVRTAYTENPNQYTKQRLRSAITAWGRANGHLEETGDNSEFPETALNSRYALLANEGVKLPAFTRSTGLDVGDLNSLLEPLASKGMVIHQRAQRALGADEGEGEGLGHLGSAHGRHSGAGLPVEHSPTASGGGRSSCVPSAGRAGERGEGGLFGG